MKTIRDQELFEILTKSPSWGTFIEYRNTDSGAYLHHLPLLSGGVDHIQVTRDAVTFHDVGCIVGGVLKDNSFQICPAKSRREREKTVDAKVINTLSLIGSKFGSAHLLAGIVEDHGLFHGEAHVDPDTGEWLFPYVEGAVYPDSYAEQGWSHPVFIAGWVNERWACSVGFGTHGVELSFSKEGELVGVVADSEPSQRCWREGNRVQQVLDLLK